MSCETRYRAIVTDLLTLAGLSDTVPLDEVIQVGHAHRYRRGSQMPTEPKWVWLHEDARRALGITGHSDQAAPAWVSSLVDRLHIAAARGNRRAILTMKLLTGGWEVVTPLLTWSDRAWLLTAKRLGISIPPAWEAWITPTRPAAVVGRLLPYVDDAVVLTEILDALIGIDAVLPESAQAVTPRQVLRVLLGQPLASYTELQQVLRAVLDGTPVVRETVTWLEEMGWSPDSSLTATLIGRASRTQERSVERSGVDAVLETVAGWIRRARGSAIDPATLRNPAPSSMVVDAITHLLRGRRNEHSDLVVVSITALMHIWQTGGWDDAVVEVVRTLGQVLANNRDDRFVFPMTVAPIVAGVVHPPHGDTIIAQLGAAANKDAWSALVAGAVYATMCRQIGYVPTVNGIESLIRVRWGERWRGSYPSPIPVLAVEREGELLLPALHAARGSDAGVHMLLDCIDAMDMLDIVGGDPQGLQSVIANAVAAGGGAVDPRIVVRLAASRCGQAILADLPTVPTPPVWPKEDIPRSAYRLIPHLVSPQWETAPQHMRDWWETAIRQVPRSHSARSRFARSRFASLLSAHTPLYPTVIPRAAVVYPHPNLVARALANPRWADVPAADRQAWLGKALKKLEYLGPRRLIEVVAHAATDTFRRDMEEMIPSMDELLDRHKHVIRQLIASDRGMSS